MRVRALVALSAMSAALAATAVPASAQSYPNGPYGAQNSVNQDAYCAQVRQNRMMIGGAIGAAVGAVLGNNLAARNAQTEGSALGGVAGAATGAVIGRNTGQCSTAAQRARQQQAYGGYQQPYGAAPAYEPAYDPRRGDYPLAGGPNSDRGYQTSGRGYDGAGDSCRWGSVTTRDPEGREIRDSVYMCRGRDGVWRPQ
jgi:outer membrane lipoprotein SlyB